MDLVELSDREYAKGSLDLLRDMDIIPNFMFKICYDYFKDLIDLDYLSNEEKTMMAYFLSQIDISFEDDELDDYNSMKFELFNYYLNNNKVLSVESKESILLFDLNLRKKRMLRVKNDQEDYIKYNCPDMYEELIRLRKENELMRGIVKYKNKKN